MPQQTINTPRDTTIQATNTALGLLGKDASLQDIKAALLQIVAALDPTADDYDQLTNKPQVNGVTLSGNKTSKQLGIRQTIPLTSAQYAQLSSAEKMDVDKDYIITDENATAAPIDDDSVSRNKVWSSYKVDEELDTLNSNLTKNKIDNVVDISSYSASTPYIVPEDGFITVGANGTSSFVQVVIKGSDGNPTGATPEVSIGRVTGWTTTTIFVRKGMQVYPTTNTAGTVVVRYFKFL